MFDLSSKSRLWGSLLSLLLCLSRSCVCLRVSIVTTFTYYIEFTSLTLYVSEAESVPWFWVFLEELKQMKRRGTEKWLFSRSGLENSALTNETNESRM